MTVTLEYVAPQSLTDAPYNPRRISDAALKRLAALLDTHGFVDPVVARKEDRLLLGGHQRLRANALRKQPDEKIPCILVAGLSDREAKALNIALNNPAAQGRYDDRKLGEVLRDLAQSDLDVPAATAFDRAQLDAVVEQIDLDIAALHSAAESGMTVPESEVLVIFEMSRPAYRRVRGQLDTLASQEGVDCHVRMDD